MSDTAVEYFYPNRMAHIILEALEEIVGHYGVNAILNQANLVHWIGHYPNNSMAKQVSFDAIAHLQIGCEEIFGPRGGRGVALRTGRACFSHGMRTLGPELGLTEPAFRMLSFSTKLEVGANALATLFNQKSDQRVRVEYKEKKIFWHIERCPLCWERHTDEPACHLAVGLLQETLYWLSGGKFFNVEETHCIACSDLACTIEIDLEALT